MNLDTVVMLLRYTIIFGGGIAIGNGWATKEQLTGLTNALPEVVAALASTVAALWGVVVRWNTKAVPIEVAARPTVPTKSPVTGKVEK